MMPAVVEFDWRAPDRLVACEVCLRDDAAVTFHRGDDHVGRFSAIEAVAAAIGDPLKRRCKFRRFP